ncbi:energy transducer TonB [Sphingomonas sp.]|uniref:energy transducer TonB n=1 Tax=Sphingomonas sp. TaxID=28214 RepID=UPI0035C7D692
MIALHAAVLLLVLHARPPRPLPTSAAPLATFDVVPPPLPTPAAPAPARQRTARPAAASGRAGATATRSAVVAPLPIVAPPLPTITAPLVPDDRAAPVGGTAALGTGTGVGSTGTGSGSGVRGDGSGAGGGTRARLVSGTIGPRDYPKPERREGISGSVTVGFVVAADGRVHGCTVAQSSGNAALDATTCRLVEARFRYAPARDANGVAVSERRGWRQRWWIERN